MNDQSDFVCGGCGHTVPADYCLRTPGCCYLCDPNITVEELLNMPPPAEVGYNSVTGIAKPVRKIGQTSSHYFYADADKLIYMKRKPTELVIVGKNLLNDEL